MRKSCLALAVLFLLSTYSLPQESLTNDSVIKMVKAGLSDDLVITAIKSKPGQYDSTVDGIIALKAAGLSDKVVAALVARASGVPSAPVASGLSTPVSGQIPQPTALAAQVTVSPTQQVPLPPPTPQFHSTDGKVRIYVTDHQIVESNLVIRGAAAAAHSQAGDDPRMVEVQADMVKECPAFVVASNNPDRADYILVFRRRGGERSSMFAFGGLSGLALSAAAKVDGASLFELSGDMVYATKKNTVEKAIKDTCQHVPVPAQRSIYTPAQ
jgi:hypothetical protein